MSNTKTFSLALTGPDTTTEYIITIDEQGRVTKALANVAALLEGERHTRQVDLAAKLAPAALKILTNNLRQQMAELSQEGALLWLLSCEGGRDSDSKSVAITGN